MGVYSTISLTSNESCRLLKIVENRVRIGCSYMDLFHYFGHFDGKFSTSYNSRKSRGNWMFIWGFIPLFRSHRTKVVDFLKLSKIACELGAHTWTYSTISVTSTESSRLLIILENRVGIGCSYGGLFHYFAHIERKLSTS